MNTMNCTHVAENNIAARYVRGQLDPRQAEAFENHYMDCPVCLAEIENAELMAEGFQRLAAEEAAKAMVAAAVATSWWQRQRIWLAAAAAVLAALAALVLLPRFATPGDTAGGQGNVPVTYLQPVRGDAAARAPAHRVQATDSGISVFVLEIDPPFHPTYRALIERNGKRVFEAGDLRLAERDTLTLSLDGSLLEPGDHLLHLDATTSEGREIRVGRFAFRVEGGGDG